MEGFETFESEFPHDVVVKATFKFTDAYLYEYIVEALRYGECRWFNHNETVAQIKGDVSAEDLRALSASLGDTPEVRGFLGLL